jgi:hypothetical protein
VKDAFRKSAEQALAELKSNLKRHSIDSMFLSTEGSVVDELRGLLRRRGRRSTRA